MQDPPAPWSEIERWLDQALEQADADRDAWLAAQPLDPALRAEVQSLLAAERESRGLLTGDAPPTLAPGEQVGVWRVQALIGRGGSGEVYRVVRNDGSFEQLAALKLLRTADDPQERQRFAAERRLLARLQDPAIARLIDGGAHRGRLYAVLELVEGRPIDQHAQALPLPARMALFEKVVAAVAGAHAQLVVHRDLKPANVFVTAAGEVRLLDFGIAQFGDPPDEAAARPATLALRLTPAYCAPEQLQGQPVGPAADVYALGVMLYQLLSGSLPWQLQGSGVQQAVQRLHEADAVPPPSQRAPAAQAAALRGDLDAIVLRCLRPSAAQRYATAAALLDELQRWRDGRAVLARGEAPAYLLGRLVRRHRVAVAGAGAVLASLVLGLLAVGWQARETARERDIAREEAAANKAVRDYLVTMFRVAGEQATPTGELSAKALLSLSAERLGRQLETQPAAAGDTLLALAQLYFQLNDYVGAAPLFERLLARADVLPPATVAQARMDLAQCLWRSGQAERGAQLLAEAQAWWARDPARYRNRLLESRLVEAQIARARGQGEESVRILAASLPERLALSGERHVDTAILLNNLATARYHAGQLAQARQDFQRAWAVWQGLQVGATGDALNTLNNWAALELREGKAAEAERLFREALALRQANLPPSAALAALQNNLGKMVLRRGAASEALPMLSEAVTLGERYAGPASQHTLSAMAGVAEAQTALGRYDAARATLDELQTRADRQWGPEHLLSGMGHLAQARWHAAQRDWAAARTRLDRAEAIWARAGAPAAPYLAQARALRAGWESAPK